MIWNQGPISPSAFFATYSDIEFWSPGNHNLNVDPLFVDPANGDYHLRTTSPCIDQGSPASARDFEGNAPVGGVDMGGDEFAPHLAVPGVVASGGPITVNVYGTPGAPVSLFASLVRTESGIETPYGSFALGLPLLPAFPLSLGAIGANSRTSITATLPPSVPPGSIIHLQAFVGGTSPALTLPFTLLIL